MRLLCLTMLPDGGALTPALKTLGYKPYTLRSSFQQGHASTHPIEWSMMLDQRKPLNKAMFGEYDCFVGPPAALLYDIILRDCPSYTKVILVEEPDKARWAVRYDAHLDNLRKSMRRASRNRVTVGFANMLEKMVVRGAEGGGREAPDSTASSASARVRGEGGPSSSVSPPGSPQPAEIARTSSSLDLEKALRTEAAKAKRPQPPPPTEPSAAPHGPPSEEEGTTEEQAEAKEADDTPMGPRAVALARYEESVRMSVPHSRLLVYRYGDGWEPLCAFLEKPLPQEPFPPYDDGLHVLSRLQERMEWAQAILYGLVGVTVAIVVGRVWPHLGSLRRFARDMYEDYQLAFATDDRGTPRRAATAPPANDFTDLWTKRGGVVTVVSHRPSA